MATRLSKFTIIYLEQQEAQQVPESDSDYDIEEEQFDESKLKKRKEMGKKISRRGISSEVFGAFNTKGKQ